MPTNDGSLNFDTQIDQSGFNQGTSKLTKAVKGLSVVLAGALGISKLIEFGKQAVELASDLEEVQNVVDTVFKDSANEINDFSKTAIDKFGLSELSAKKYASSLGAIIKPSGIASKKISEMAQELTGATGGLSSFFNRSADLINQDILSFFSGSSEVLAKYGVNANISAIESFNLARGIDKSFNSMTDAEKQLTRYDFFVEQLGYTFNDFEKTQDSFANQTRILTERWKEFLTLIGRELIQVLNPAIKLLNILLESLINATKQFIAFYSAVTGEQIKQTSSISENIDESEKNQIGLGKAVDKTNKKLKGTLASFDEINVLQQEVGEQATPELDFASKAGDFSVSTEAIESTKEFNPFLQKFLDLMIPIQEINLSNLTDSLVKLGDSLLNISGVVLDNILMFLNDFLVPISKILIEDYVPQFIELLANAIDILAGSLQFFKPLGEFLLNEIITPLEVVAYSKIAEGLSKINDSVDEFSDTIRKNQDDTAQTPSIWQTVFDTIAPIVNRLKRTIINVFRTIGNVFKSLIDNVILPLLLPAFYKIQETIATIFPQIRDDLTITFGGIGGLFLSFYDEILVPFWNYFADEILPIVKPVFDEVGKLIADTFDNAISHLSNFIGVLSGLLTFISGIFTGDWEKAWLGVRQVFESIFSSLVNLVRIPLNFIIRAINEVLRQIESIKVTIPAIPLLGIKEQTIGFGKFKKITEIPAFAQGVALPLNIPQQPQQAQLSREDINRSINESVQQALREQNINIEFQGSLSQLGRILQPLVTKEGNRQGGSISLGGVR